MKLSRDFFQIWNVRCDILIRDGIMWWLLFCVLMQCVNSLRIIHMRVPEVVLYGTKDSVILDCDYVTNNVTGLVVKWFFEDREQPVYQWIPPQRPQALGILKNKLDLTHRVSQNPYTQHRALRIISPNTTLSGNYTCVVSTFLDEAERTKPMTIFVPEKRFVMILDRLDDKYLNIICSAENIFPRPELSVLIGSRPIVNNTKISFIGDRYTIFSSAVVNVDDIPPTVEILCELQVPDAKYISRKREIFYKDPPPTSPDPTNPDTHTASDLGCTITPPSFLLCIIFLHNYLILR